MLEAYTCIDIHISSMIAEKADFCNAVFKSFRGGRFPLGQG